MLRTPITIAFALSFAGCLHVNGYTAAGTVNVNTNEVPNRAAVVYWYGEEGRLWYGAKHKVYENTASASICNSLPIELVDKGPKVGVVVLADSNGNDYLTHAFYNGVWTELKAPMRQHGGSPTCGQLLVRSADNTLETAYFSDVTTGTNMVLAVTCARGSTAALQPGLYDLGPVQIAQMDEKPNTPPAPTSAVCQPFPAGFATTVAVQPAPAGPGPAPVVPAPAPAIESASAAPERAPTSATAP